MKLTVSESSLGTSEAEWLSSSKIAECSDLHLDKRAKRRIVIVAPHPDDEVLAAGGTLRALASEGDTEITVIAVTDGEASHPRSPTLSRDELAMRRADERARALEELGLGRVTVIRLRIPDGGVALTPAFVERLRETLLETRADICLAPFEKDGHPDHDATGLATAMACAEAGVDLLRYPIWAWHWARPETEDLPWDNARRVNLSADVLAAKRAAIFAFDTQIAPLSTEEGDEAILPPAVLARFLRPFEIVFV